MPKHVEGLECECWGCMSERMKGDRVEASVLDQETQYRRAMCWRYRDQLLEQTPEFIKVEGEGPRLGMQKPLLLELQEQVRPSGEGGAGGSGFGPGLPVAAEALSLMQDIEREVAEQLWELPGADRPEKLADRIRFWVQSIGEDKARINACHAVLSGWVQQIGDLFNPPTVVQMRRMCPACQQTHVWEEKDGERVQNRAVIARIRPGAEPSVVIDCKSCGAHWQGSSIHDLEQDTRGREA